MAIINCTPHDIHIYDAAAVTFVPAQRKYILNMDTIGIVSLHTIIPKSGQMLSAKMDTRQDGYTDDGISIVLNTVTAIDPLPPGDDLCIVSQIYASAVRKLGLPTDRLLCIGDPVYATTDGKQPMGCLNLQRA